MTEKTDKDGWSYANNFHGKFTKKQHKIDFVRRRKWTRTCYKIDSE